MNLRIGGRARVIPDGRPAHAAIGKITLLSGNGCAIAVGFDSAPPWSRKSGIAVHPEHGVMFFAVRHGPTDGPWVEMMAGGRFEIEEVED